MLKQFKIIAVTVLLLTLAYTGLVVAPSYVFAEGVTNPELLQESAGPTLAPDATIDITTGVDTGSQPPFTVEIVVGTQSPWNQRVPVTVKVRPSVDTTRTNITWDAPIGVTINDKNSQKYMVVKKGEVYTTEITIDPIVSGTYTIAATATDWGYGANFASTESINITFDENLIVTPSDPGYSSAVIFRYIIIFFGFIVLGFVLLILGKLAIKKLKEFLKPPEL